MKNANLAHIMVHWQNDRGRAVVNHGLLQKVIMLNFIKLSLAKTVLNIAEIDIIFSSMIVSDVTCT